MAASDELRAALVDLTAERDYRFWFDPYWARVHPYRVPVARGGRADATLVVRNFLDVPSVFGIRIACPPGVRVDPAVATLRVPAGDVKPLPLVFSGAADAPAGLALAALDVTQDGVRRGQLFDCILDVTA
jgi:hypothetical protein